MEINGRYIAINDMREVGKIKKFKNEDTWYYKITYRNSNTRLIKFKEDEMDIKVTERKELVERHLWWLSKGITVLGDLHV
jgi:hypothetical protein